MSRRRASIAFVATGLAVATSGCSAEELDFDTAAESLDSSVLLDALPAVDAATRHDTDASLDMDAFDAFRREDRRGFHLSDAEAGGDDGGPALSQCGSENDCARLELGLHCLLGDGSVGACVECVTSDDCLNPAFQRCDPTLNRCVQCDVSADCRADEVCLADVTHTCIPSCLGVACPGRAGICDKTRNLCVSCTDNTGCDLGFVCDTLTGQCGLCAGDGDCHQKPYLRCDRTAVPSVCVECLSNSDCGKGACNTHGLCVGGAPPVEMKGDE